MSRFAFLLLLLISAAPLSGRTARVIDSPDYECRTTGDITFTRVERLPDATRLYARISYRPGWWVCIDSTAVIADPASDARYALSALEGMKIGVRFAMPASGRHDVVLVYPPLPDDTDEIDFLFDDWTVYGLRLDGGKASKPAVVDARQWAADNDAPYPGPPAEFFNSGTTRLHGVVSGYSPQLGFDNMMVYVYDVVTGQSQVATVEIRPDGTFDRSFHLPAPGQYTMALAGVYQTLYLEPGRSLALYLDWDDMLGYKSSRSLANVRFGDELGRVNTGLNGAPKAPQTFAYDLKKSKRERPSRFAARLRTDADGYATRLATYLGRPDVEPHAARLLRHNLATHKACQTLNFEMYRKMKTPSDSIDFAAERLPLSFYAPVREALDQTDPWFLSGTSVSELSNRLAYNAMADSLGEDSRSLLRQVCKASRVANFGYFDFSKRTRVQVDSLLTATATAGSVTDPDVMAGLRRYLDDGMRRAEGYYLPDDESGRIVADIIAPHRGKVIVLDLWGLYCGPCRSNIEEGKALREANRDNPDFKFIFVTSHDQAPQADYEDYVARHLDGEECHVVSESDFNRLRELFNFSGIPRYVLIDRDGRILNDNYRISNLPTDLPARGIPLTIP